MPATSTGLNRLPFLLWPLTVLMKQTTQPVRAIKQSIFLDVYGLAKWDVYGCDTKMMCFIAQGGQGNKVGIMEQHALKMLTTVWIPTVTLTSYLGPVS